MDIKEVKKHAEAVCYEYEMFRVACVTATRPQEIPGSAVEQERTRRAMLECMLLHARNLYDFLANDKPARYKDDLLAEHFIDGYNPRPNAMEYVRKNRERIHKLLAHISKTRPSIDRIWRLDLFWKEITAAWEHFRAELERTNSDYHQIFAVQTNAIKFRLPDKRITVTNEAITTATTEQFEAFIPKGPIQGET